MTQYGQFCPVAKAAEIVAERWTPLILRELLSGSHRFSDLQRGVPLMSPALLSRRLKRLEQTGLVERRKAGSRAEYHLTEAGEDLRPIIMSLGAWGKRWAADLLEPIDYDVMLLMWDIRRRVEPQRLPADPAVVYFHVPDAAKGKRHFWLLRRGDETELCLSDPGYDVSLSIESGVRSLVDVWMGYRDLDDARTTGDLELSGGAAMVRAFPRWFARSVFAEA